ncbi:MAG: type II secretion system major pseudopilin GspG [Planctomycetota bacterium]
MRTRKARRAFTLLEVLMVVVIIGLLAAFVAPQFFGAGDRAKKDLARAAVDSGLSGTLDLYKVHMGEYPTSDGGGLKLLLERPDDEEQAKKWEGPYLKKAANLKDPWEHDWLYECPGRVNTTSYDLGSAGPDGQEGTEDDITNYERS